MGSSYGVLEGLASFPLDADSTRVEAAFASDRKSGSSSVPVMEMDWLASVRRRFNSRAKVAVPVARVRPLAVCIHPESRLILPFAMSAVPCHEEKARVAGFSAADVRASAPSVQLKLSWPVAVLVSVRASLPESLSLSAA